jgi:hypothetical protein
VLAQYEDACRALGMHPGLVELSGLALLGGQPTRPGDHLLVNWDEGYVTLILARDSWPLLIRTLAGEPAADPEEVAREIGNTALYYRERLGGSGIESATVRSGFLPPDEALGIVSGAVGIQAELLHAPAGLAEGTWTAAHVVAGAAACVLREAA